MTKAFSKNDLLNRISDALKQDTNVIAAWVGGSTATGFEDSLSDIDIVAICKDPQRPFQIIEQALNSQFSILQTWNVEDSPFQGLYQKFYVLNGTPETFYIDAGVFASLNPKDYEEYYNRERHGVPHVLFDKIGILREASLSPKIEAQPNFKIENWMARFEIVYRTFLKESMRGKFIDSFLFYQRLIQMMIQILRIRHSPQKHDFGFRYLYRDLPASESEFIEKLLKVSDIETLQANARLIKARVLEMQKDGL